MAAGAALSFPLVTMMLALGISGIDAPTSPLLRDFPLVVGILGFVIYFAGYRAVLSIHEPKRFAMAATALVIVGQATIVLFGIFIHRDYFSAFYSSIAAWIVLLLYWIGNLPPFTLSRDMRRAIGQAALLAFFLFAIWIMMMGYAISTRQEPRPIEALAYNAYNMLAAFGMLVFSRQLIIGSYRIVVIGQDTIEIEGGLSLGGIVGEKGMKILRIFFGKVERGVTCSELSELIQKDTQAANDSRNPCSTCTPDNMKATTCVAYRNLYNTILELRKVLEFVGIGTILPPQNKMKIREEGWRLVLFDGVRVHMRARVLSRNKAR